MSDINVVTKTQRIIVDAPTRTVSVIIAGPQGPAGPPGSDGPNLLVVPWTAHLTTYTLSNSPLAERFVNVQPGVALRFVSLVDHTQVRLVANVVVASASANTPRCRLLYKAGAYSGALGDYAELGVTEVGFSLSTGGHKDTGWIDLVAGATGEIFVALTERGGDGVVDPSLGYVQAYFR